MKTITIETNLYDWPLENDEELRSDDVILVSTNLKDYTNINEDEKPTDNDVIIPLFATVHSGVFFQVDQKNLSSWDSGQAGIVILKKAQGKDLTPYLEEARKLAEKATAIFNGWVYEVSAVEIEYCDCCGAERGREYLDGGVVFNDEQQEEAKKALTEQFNITADGEEKSMISQHTTAVHFDLIKKLVEFRDLFPYDFDANEFGLEDLQIDNLVENFRSVLYEYKLTEVDCDNEDEKAFMQDLETILEKYNESEGNQ